MPSPQSEIRFLASVRSVREALHATSNGADIVDCKDPDGGALGALDCQTIAEIRTVVPPDIPVSATVGDDAASAPDLLERVARRAMAGVDFVKIGFEAQTQWQDAVARLSEVDFGGCQLVGVLLADRGVDLALVKACATAGFCGVLLDTRDKTVGALPDIAPQSTLSAFVEAAHNNGLFAGLAGALRAKHIPELAALRPDILGFRGALCHNSGRQNELDAEAVAAIRAVIDTTQPVSHLSPKTLEVSLL